MDSHKKNKIEFMILPDSSYTVQHNAYCFLPGDRKPKNTAGNGLLGKIQEIIKKNGTLYYLLVSIFSPTMLSHNFRRSLKMMLNRYGKEATILNIGSGPRFMYGRTDIINVDLYAFKEVDVVSDASTLPIKSESVDLIINLGMLEHVEAPGKILLEMQRVLKKDGRFFCCFPFIQPFHAAPCDFYRWTIEGVQKSFSLFHHIETGIAAGPTSGMLWIVQEWLAILFSFGSRTLHDIVFLFLMVVTSPFKLLDFFLVHFPNAEKIAGGFYIKGQK